MGWDGMGAMDTPRMQVWSWGNGEAAGKGVGKSLFLWAAAHPALPRPSNAHGFPTPIPKSTPRKVMFLEENEREGREHLLC